MITKTLSDDVLIEQFKSMHQDGMTIFTLGGGSIRGAFFHGTRFVNKLRLQHELGLMETLLLGHACLCAALLIPTMKGRDRAVFRCDTDGAAAGFNVEAFSEGFVRGYLFQNPLEITGQFKSWDLKPLFGSGTVSVTRFPEGYTQPVTGIVQIKHKNIAMDLSEYFLQSEQTTTGFNTGIQFDKDGRVIGAGGMYIQVMPDAESDIVDAAEHAFAAAPSFGQWFAEGGGREDVIYGLFRSCNPQVPAERSIDFYCPCSKDNFFQKLMALPKQELSQMRQSPEEYIELTCRNCGSVYKYPKEELISSAGVRV